MELRRDMIFEGINHPASKRGWRFFGPLFFIIVFISSDGIMYILTDCGGADGLNFNYSQCCYVPVYFGACVVIAPKTGNLKKKKR
jgi:hypothetical protein